MRTKDVIYARRAVREYSPVALADQTIRELIDAAIQAPSAMDDQPWSFAVVKDRLVLDEISSRALLVIRTWPLDGEFKQLVDDPNCNIFYNASTLVVICAKPVGTRPDWDCCLAAENLMLEAREMGIGSCVIGLALPALSDAHVKKMLHIPEAYTPVMPIILGTPLEFPPPHGRKPPEILCWIAPAHASAGAGAGGP